MLGLKNILVVGHLYDMFSLGLSSQAFKEYKYSHLIDVFDFYYQGCGEHSPDPSVKISACLSVFPSVCVDTSSQQRCQTSHDIARLES